MLLVSICSYCIWDETSNVVWVSKLAVILRVRSLEVVVDEPTLLLLAQGEVVRLELGFEVSVGNFSLSFACITCDLLYELLLCLRSES